MSAFVISLVVVGAAVVLIIRVVLEHAAAPDKPATPRRRSGRARPAGAQTVVSFGPSSTGESLVPTALRRIRSGLLLIVIITVLGALTALLLVVGGTILLTGVRNAVQ